MTNIKIVDALFSDVDRTIIVIQIDNCEKWSPWCAAIEPACDNEHAYTFFDCLYRHHSCEISHKRYGPYIVHCIDDLGLMWVQFHQMGKYKPFEFVNPTNDSGDEFVKFMRDTESRKYWSDTVQCIFKNQDHRIFFVGTFFFSADRLHDLYEKFKIKEKPAMKVRPKRIHAHIDNGPESYSEIIQTDSSYIEDIQRSINTMVSNGKSAGEISDGYHTFNELYDHRAKLFAALCNTVFKNNAWKSLHHHDPSFPMYDGMFIVGIETPFGQATYHYDIDPYWNMFNVKELDRAKEFDGHTPEEAVARILDYANLLDGVNEKMEQPANQQNEAVDMTGNEPKCTPLQDIICALAEYEDCLCRVMIDNQSVIIFYRFDEDHDSEENFPIMKCDIVYRGIRYKHDMTAIMKRRIADSYESVGFRFTRWAAFEQYTKPNEYKSDRYICHTKYQEMPSYIKNSDIEDKQDETH